MSEIVNFNKLFINRTLDLLEANWVGFEAQNVEVSALVNCMVALLCLVESSLEENKYRSNVFNSYFRNNKLSYKFKPFSNSDWDVKNLESYVIDTQIDLSSAPGKNVVDVIKKLRNSFAHGNLLPINKLGKWEGIRVWNVRESKNVKEIDFIFEIKTLNMLSLYKGLANAHLESLESLGIVE